MQCSHSSCHAQHGASCMPRTRWLGWPELTTILPPPLASLRGGAPRCVGGWGLCESHPLLPGAVRTVKVCVHSRQTMGWGVLCVSPFEG